MGLEELVVFVEEIFDRVKSPNFFSSSRIIKSPQKIDANKNLKIIKKK